MATQVRQFTATIPANTLKTALATVPLSLDYVDIESIDLEVPPGPAGLMGFYIARSGQQVIPFESGEFLVWDDRFDSWYLTDQPTGGGWEIVGYNLDVYDHAVVVRFHTNPVQSANTVVPSPLTFIASGSGPSLVVR